MAEMEYGKTIPPEYHGVLFIGKPNRAGEIIDFKHPPTFIHSDISLEDYKERIFKEHTPAINLPIKYPATRPFIILRPTALDYNLFALGMLDEFGLNPVEVLEIENFMKLADSLYVLDHTMDFTWKWRSIMRGLHDTGIQNQDNAIVYFFDDIFLTDEAEYKRLVSARSNIRREIGSTPYLFFNGGGLEFGMDLHHLHTPDFDLVEIEFNALMHAVNKTSIFSQ